MDILLSNKFKLDKKNLTDGLVLLSEITDSSISTAFFDPQYRGLLDKLQYGNEGETRGKARSSLPQMDDETIKKFIHEIDRTLKPTGHLFLWVDKFHLCEGVMPWSDGTDLELVDMIVWDKNRMKMGWRSRHVSEYIVVFQKKPTKAKDVWTDHNILDIWKEEVVKTHPHSKPVGLQRRLILATTKPGDVVLDPAAGGFSVLEACKDTGRHFIGGDIAFGTVQSS